MGINFTSSAAGATGHHKKDPSEPKAEGGEGTRKTKDFRYCSTSTGTSDLVHLTIHAHMDIVILMEDEYRQALNTDCGIEASNIERREVPWVA